MPTMYADIRGTEYIKLMAQGFMMPRISQFLGILIYMYYNDHLPPHFHAKYAESEVLIRIDTLTVFRGELPRKEQALVIKWASLHKEELNSNWELARKGSPLQPIDPLAQ